MSVKARLAIRLYADEVLVAESEDATLWQRVFSAIQAPTRGDLLPEPADGTGTNPRARTSTVRPGLGLEGFAEELGLAVDEVDGALGPAQTEPFLHLDPHCWEAFKKNTPPRGPQAIAPIALAAASLALWFRHAGIEGNPSQAQAQAVLGTINLRDQNATRGIKNTEWLQTRGGAVVINPAQRSKAIRIVSAFCTKRSPLQAGDDQ